MREHRYALPLDVRAYFPSIDRCVLRSVLERRIRDAAFLDVLSLSLEAGATIYDDPELRAFARLVYLNALDHYLKRDLRVPGYLRYVDDMFLFADRRRATMLPAGPGRVELQDGERLPGYVRGLDPPRPQRIQAPPGTQQIAGESVERVEPAGDMRERVPVDAEHVGQLVLGLLAGTPHRFWVRCA